MREIPWKPADANWLTPYLMVQDAENTLAFYQRAFGFAQGTVLRADDGRIVHAEARYMDTLIVMFATEGTFGSEQKAPATSEVASPIGLYLYCENVDMLMARAVQAGAEQLGPVEEMFWGDRVGRLRDLDGYVWNFATKVAEFDPDKVPRF